MRKSSAVITAVILVLFQACGNTPPELNQTYSRVNIRMTPEGVITAELLVFVNAEDEDGEDDIEELYIVDDDRQLYWKTNRGAWSERTNRGMNLTGGEMFMMPGGELPGAGTYRLLLVDRAGEQVEDEIFIPLVKQLPRPEEFPEIIFNSGKDGFEIKSPNQRNIVSFHDKGGTVISSFAMSPGSVSIKKLKNGNDIFSKYKYIRIGYYSNSYGVGIISGPWDSAEEQ